MIPYLYLYTNTSIMSRILTSLILILAVCALNAQGIEGSWTGKITIPQGELRINFHITAGEDGYTSTMDSPDQGAFGLPVDSTLYVKPELTIKMASINFEYNGTLTGSDEIKGSMLQHGQTLELNLIRKSAKLFLDPQSILTSAVEAHSTAAWP
jgi:hypothetical protein